MKNVVELHIFRTCPTKYFHHYWGLIFLALSSKTSGTYPAYPPTHAEGRIDIRRRIFQESVLGGFRGLMPRLKCRPLGIYNCSRKYTREPLAFLVNNRSRYTQSTISTKNGQMPQDSRRRRTFSTDPLEWHLSTLAIQDNRLFICWGFISWYEASFWRYYLHYPIRQLSKT